jgi:hypothetical protein
LWITPVSIGDGRYAILYLHLLPYLEVAIAQRSPPLSNLGRGLVSLRQNVAAQAVREFAGIDPIILFLGGGDRAQHQRLRSLLGTARSGLRAIDGHEAAGTWKAART